MARSPEVFADRRRAARIVTAIGGFGFIVFFITAATVYAGGAGRDSNEIVAYYSQQSNRLAQVTGFVANTLWASSAFTTMIERGYQIDPRSHLLFEDSGFAFLVAGGVMGAAFVGATSVGAAVDRVWPSWLSWLGFPVGAAVLAVYWYLPLFAFFTWIAVVSVASLRKERHRA